MFFQKVQNLFLSLINSSENINFFTTFVDVGDFSLQKSNTVLTFGNFFNK